MSDARVIGALEKIAGELRTGNLIVQRERLLDLPATLRQTPKNRAEIERLDREIERRLK